MIVKKFDELLGQSASKMKDPPLTKLDPVQFLGAITNIIDKEAPTSILEQ